MRYELKYKVEDLNIELVRQVIKNHPASFYKIFPDRQVNNIYFDTPSFTTYTDNVMGIAQRKKFRVRWYGAKDNTRDKNTFEIKIKDNQLGRKENHPFDHFDLNELQPIASKVNAIIARGTNLSPVLMNAYQRSYFGTRNQQFRITIDHQLCYRPLADAGRRPKYVWTDPSIIVELKYEEGLEKESELIKQFLPFRQTKSSKYVTGMSMLIKD